MIHFRPPNPSDWLPIAQLHARSWQEHYRGSFSDAYLDGPVIEDRKKVWEAKFTAMPGHMRILLAEREGQLLGFVCYLINEDEKLGTYINNLHVSKDAQGLGIGRSLLRQASANTKKETGNDKLYLYVLTQNEGAIGFYEKLGGKIIRKEMHENPDGGAESAEVYKMAWTRPIQ